MVNMLTLAGPLYMLQVYDRVLASHSVPTLVALSVLLCGAFALQGFMDLIRSRVVTRSAGFLDEHLSAVVHRAIIRLSAGGGQIGEAHEPVRDLDQIRTFLTGQGPIALVDLPWIPVFLLICALIHPSNAVVGRRPYAGQRRAAHRAGEPCTCARCQSERAGTGDHGRSGSPQQ